MEDPVSLYRREKRGPYGKTVPVIEEGETKKVRSRHRRRAKTDSG